MILHEMVTKPEEVTMFLKNMSLALIITFTMTCIVCALMPDKALAINRSVKDNDIKSAVEYELSLDRVVDSHQIDVGAVEGVVMLYGSVNNLLAKERAVEIAKSIEGARSVIDDITLETSQRPDDDLRWDVVQALLQDPGTDSYEIDVNVDYGVVTLTGKVDSWKEKQLSTAVVKGVSGVRSVRNDLDFTLKSHRPDPEIAGEVESLLAYDIWVDARTITVEADDGLVKLRGTVGGEDEKATAYSDAWVSGVSSVDISGLKVDPMRRNRMRRENKYVKIPDEDIRQAVDDALVYDPRVYSFHSDVSVEDGVVTLSGTVDNLEARNAAEQDARNTVGVSRVKNLLKIGYDVSVSYNDGLDKAGEARIARDEPPVRNHMAFSAQQSTSGKERLDGTDHLK